MRMIVIAVAILLLANGTMPAQVVLNAGDTLNFEFNSLTFTGTLPPSEPIKGGFTFPCEPDPPMSSDRYFRMWLFEDSSTEHSLWSDDENCSVFPSVPGAWQDLEGLIRIHVFNGTLRIDEIRVRVTTPGEGVVNLYEGVFTPVPEPSITLLLLTGVVGACACGRWRRTLFPSPSPAS